ncbi:DUF4097 family beta strand repeat-containing protein [Actinomadura rubrisoli]|uniref:DUF4097 domain-containing protein n=1 Tax=Actinomadura rubrisoli TaxID=2530368 RepID=A0A4R5BBK4_9ACTN|nr:DUF4097 family beta strand repeat-containing protein [Actinomadura rubrisoli]TDD82046.1 hypothetical protein E1298_23260 [Actinomadura rubrisoli]
MLTFSTPEPILASIRIEAGVVRITAEARADTVVEVAPNSDVKADVQAAEQTLVDYAAGELVVRTPRARSLFGSPGMVAVEVALPRGSRLSGSAGMGDLICAGRLWECEFRTGAGKLRVEDAGTVRLRTQHGDVTLGRATDDVEVTTGSGELRIGRVGGGAEIKNSNGNTWIDEITGDLRLKIANGNVDIGRAHASVTSRAANGGVRIKEVIRGRVELQTKAGDLEVGIHEGTAAWLDVKSRSGTVHNALDCADGPGECSEVVELHARTGFGDIVISRTSPW